MHLYFKLPFRLSVYAHLLRHTRRSPRASLWRDGGPLRFIAQGFGREFEVIAGR